MELDFQNEMHYRFFIEMAQFAGQELDMLKRRLGGARRVKISSGAYAGGNITIGYYVDIDPKSSTFEQFLEYKPHADIVRTIFQIALEAAPTIKAIHKEINNLGLFFPFFSEELASWINSRTALRLCSKEKNSEGVEIGYKITRSVIRGILCNPAYIGLPFRGGQFLEGNEFPKIVEQPVFDHVFEKFFHENTKPRGKFLYEDPYPLQGILFSKCKDGEVRPVYSCNTQGKLSK